MRVKTASTAGRVAMDSATSCGPQEQRVCQKSGSWIAGFPEDSSASGERQWEKTNSDWELGVSTT